MEKKMTKENRIVNNDIIFDDRVNFDDINLDTRDEDQIKDDYEKRAEYVDENLWNKLEKAGKKISFAKDIVALYRYMKDSFVSWHRKAIVIIALIYFISPIDTIPDVAPLFGYLDDLGVITALLKFLGSELTPFYDSGYRV